MGEFFLIYFFSEILQFYPDLNILGNESTHMIHTRQ